jgi:carboxyl-terminal processing protease
MQHVRKAGFAVALAATFMLGGFILPDQEAQTGPNLFRDVLTLVSTRYVDTMEVSEVYERAAEGLVDQLGDPYADLFSPEELEDFTIAYEGHYAGVGMVIETQNEATIVRRVFPNTPAERHGVQPGDRVLSVGGEGVAGWPLERVSNALRGEPGTDVEVIFARYGVAQPIETAITRAVVRIPAVPYSTVVSGDVGYIPLLQFNETAANEVAEGVRKLVAEGATGLVLDLRGNGGGIVDQAVRIAGMFLAPGSGIARQWERGSDETTYRNENAPIAPDLPLVVLVDEASASASEIVAGALQDHDRAVVLGNTTFGKGLVQTAYRVDGGYVLKMTTGKWFTPNGRSIHRERVLENGRLVEVDDSTHFAAGRDERPTYHSDAGRVVYGGGGIMPDLQVELDTLSTAEQELRNALFQSPDFSVAVSEMAAELRGQVGRDFTIRSEWRADLYDRLIERGLDLERPLFEDGAPFVDRFLMDRIGRMAFGDAYAKLRDVENDTQLLKAVEVIHSGGPDQRGLFGYVERVKDGSS